MFRNQLSPEPGQRPVNNEIACQKWLGWPKIFQWRSHQIGEVLWKRKRRQVPAFRHFSLVLKIVAYGQIAIKISFSCGGLDHHGEDAGQTTASVWHVHVM